MPSTTFAGSVVAALQTVHIVGTVSAAGVYVFKVDTSNLVAGDELELKIADRVSAVGTIALAYSASYAHRQATQVKISPPIPVTQTAFFQLVQRAGSAGRSFSFEVVSI